MIPRAIGERLRGRRVYRPVALQTLYYLARPHSHVPSAPVTGPCAWHSRDHADEASWTDYLQPDDIRAIEAGLARLAHARRPLHEMRAHHLPLPDLATHIEAWRRQLSTGRGFVRIRGVPVDRWSNEDVERFFWALGQHLGVPGAQNGEGHLLGHVRDLRLGQDGQVRQYKTSEAIEYHCDTADVVGLLCIRGAQRGGLSRIASSVAVFNRILARRPELAPVLFSPFHVDTRGDGGTDSFCVQPSAYYQGRLRTFYHSEYMRTVQRYPAIPALTERQLEILDLYRQLTASPEFHLEMDFQPGDIQLISNHTIVHARTGYTDASDLDQRRHLLRLWLSIEPLGSLRERTLRARALVAVVGRLGRRKWALRRAAGRR